MHKFWTWVEGRQAGGYAKMLLACKSPYFDLYLLRFPRGCEIKSHRDQVSGRKHFRLNWVFWRAERGGTFICAGKDTVPGKKVHFFRPDVCAHRMTKVDRGTQYALSIGWTRA